MNGHREVYHSGNFTTLLMKDSAAFHKVTGSFLSYYYYYYYYVSIHTTQYIIDELFKIFHNPHAATENRNLCAINAAAAPDSVIESETKARKIMRNSSSSSRGKWARVGLGLFCSEEYKRKKGKTRTREEAAAAAAPRLAHLYTAAARR